MTYYGHCPRCGASPMTTACPVSCSTVSTPPQLTWVQPDLTWVQPDRSWCSHCYCTPEPYHGGLGPHRKCCHCGHVLAEEFLSGPQMARGGRNHDDGGAVIADCCLLHVAMTHPSPPTKCPKCGRRLVTGKFVTERWIYEDATTTTTEGRE